MDVARITHISKENEGGAILNMENDVWLAIAIKISDVDRSSRNIRIKAGKIDIHSRFK